MSLFISSYTMSLITRVNVGSELRVQFDVKCSRINVQNNIDLFRLGLPVEYLRYFGRQQVHRRTARRMIRHIIDKHKRRLGSNVPNCPYGLRQIALRMATRKFLQSRYAFFHWIPTDFAKNNDSKAIYLSKVFLVAILWSWTI